MIPTLLEIPFDHYQRYGAAAHLLQTLEVASARVLEVGANRQRLLGQFLPQASCLYTDLHVEGDEKDFVVADATDLPFPDQSFDAVVSLDVLEHIPAPLRGQAAAEMARVAARAVVVGFPPDKPWVQAAESDANGRWRELFGEDYVWLEEHKELGLVDTAEIVATFEAAGMQVLRFGQGDAKLWSSLMGAHFVKVKYPELETLVAAADRLYNSRVFAGDHSDEPYREYCVAVRSDEDVARLLANPPFTAKPDEEATTLLSALAGGLRDLARRTANSETEWASTARLLDTYITDLEAAKHEWGASAAYAGLLQSAKDDGDAEMLKRIEQWHHREAGMEQEVVLKDQEIDRSKQEIEAVNRQFDEFRRHHEAGVRRADEAVREQNEAFARSRNKWKVAMLVLAVGGPVLGYLFAWGLQ